MYKLKMKKVVFVLFTIILVFLSIYPTNVQASNELGMDDVMSGASSFIDAGSKVDNPLKTDDLKDVSSVLYNILLIVGIIVAVVIGLIIAIKMMTGSVSQKAETKELIVPYLIGCVVVFGAFGIWRIAVLLINQTQ